MRGRLHYADTGPDTPGGNRSILVQKQQGIKGKSSSKKEKKGKMQKRNISGEHCSFGGWVGPQKDHFVHFLANFGGVGGAWRG